MRSMKTLLRLLGAVSLTTVAASSVVACGSKAPEIHVDVAKELDWYDAQGKSKIKQKLNRDDTVGKEKYSIIADDSLIKPTELFKTKLLIQGSTVGKFKAKNTEATKFLSDLGFKSGSESKDYSTDDVAKITALIAKVTSSTPGKIEENGTTDFKVSDGNCQVDIMDKVGDGAKVVKSYTIKTLKNDTLDINATVITNLIVNKNGLKLTDSEGFKQGQPISSFKLKIKSDIKQKQFDSLIILLNTNVNTKFFSAVTGGTEVTGNFSTTKVFLEIHFGNVVLSSRIDCGIPNA
ncbi:hypothetical protein [Spiroplasma ixodetis]|uniref:hypothetical protein n=2 Tax=Bacteria TaxID=2 RepID=UPI002575EA92|nr:hypothetical protein [Spiroplasma ixodetis]WJG71368.1 hypothetical protein SIXOD_v1c27920 [Spiroplasma ixodetis Y32]